MTIYSEEWSRVEVSSGDSYKSFPLLCQKISSFVIFSRTCTRNVGSVCHQMISRSAAALVFIVFGSFF